VIIASIVGLIITRFKGWFFELTLVIPPSAS
jgi:hypothetical protein